MKIQQKSNMFGTEYKNLDCPYLRHCFKVFWVALCEKIGSYFWSEYRKIRTRNNSVFGHFSCNESTLPATIYLFKINNKNTKKCVKYVQS